MSQVLTGIATGSAYGNESEVRLVRVDKIASSTVNLGLTHELEITARCEAKAGNVVVVRTLLGLLAGGTISLAYTMGARLAPSERSSLTLSVLASCGMLGSATAPILAGMLGQLSLRIVFLATAAAYLIAVVLVLLPTRVASGEVRVAPDETPAGSS